MPHAHLHDQDGYGLQNNSDERQAAPRHNSNTSLANLASLSLSSVQYFYYIV